MIGLRPRETWTEAAKISRGGDQRAPAVPAREGDRGARSARSTRRVEVAVRAAGRPLGTFDRPRRAPPPRGGRLAEAPAHLGRPRAHRPRLPRVRRPDARARQVAGARPETGPARGLAPRSRPGHADRDR